MRRRRRKPAPPRVPHDFPKYLEHASNRLH